MENEITICKNCGNQFRLNFCNSCGQKANTFRITWKEVIHNLPHAIFHLDEGLVYTIKQLATRPGDTIREYLEGKRKPHFNPFLLFVLAGSLASYLFVHFHVRTLLASVQLDELEEQNALIVHKYFAIRTIFFCLVCSIGDYFIFRAYKYTLPEMAVANVFSFCGIAMLQLITFPLLLLDKQMHVDAYLRIFLIAAVMGYLFMVRYQFYNAKANRKLIIRIVMAILFYVLIVLLAAWFLVKPFFEK